MSVGQIIKYHKELEKLNNHIPYAVGDTIWISRYSRGEFKKIIKVKIVDQELTTLGAGGWIIQLSIVLQDGDSKYLGTDWKDGCHREERGYPSQVSHKIFERDYMTGRSKKEVKDKISKMIISRLDHL